VLLHVHHLGDPDGDPLVCLHGVCGHGRRFVHLADRLPGRHLIAPDLRGHGASGKQPPWDVITHVNDLLETIEPPMADWLGFSFGGRLAAEIAARYPERVRSLILLDPALQLPPELAHAKADGARARDEYATFEEAVKGEKDPDDPYETPRHHLEEEVRENFVLQDGRYVARWDPAAVVVAFSEMARTAPPDAEVPTLTIEGDESWVPARGRGTVKRLNSGHGVLWDALDDTARAVHRHLESRP
jgi:lipase